MVRASKSQPTLKAPELKSLVFDTVISSSPRGGTYTNGTADVGTQVPDTAAALIVYEVTKTGNVARSWHSVVGTPPEPKTTKVIAYQSGGRCNQQIPGVEPIRDGATAVVAWLDTSGRLSPVSKPVTVRSTVNRR